METLFSDRRREHLLLSPDMRERIFQLWIFLLLYFMIPYNRCADPVTVECGSTRNDTINVTYVGEATAVYSTANEAGCAAVQTSTAVWEIKGANDKPCGLEWDQQLETYTFSIRVQVGVVLSNSDPVFTVTCVYGNSTREEHLITIQDPNFKLLVKSSTVDIKKLELTVLDENSQNISTVEYGKQIKLFVDANNVTSDTVDVTSCSIVDSINEDDPNFKLKILYQSCGTGYQLASNQGFRVINQNTFQTDLFTLQNMFTGVRYVVCYLTVCFSNTTTCSQGCVIPYQPQSGAVQSIIATAKLEVQEPPPVPTTTTTTTKAPTVICNPSNILKTSDDFAVQVPYIVSLSVLLFILIIFAALLVAVSRHYIFRRCEKRQVVSPPPISFIPVPHLEPNYPPDAYRHQFHRSTNLPRYMGYSDYSSDTSSSSRSSKSLIRRKRKNKAKSSLRFTYEMDKSPDERFRFYCGRGTSYSRRVESDPTMLTRVPRY
ncbi:unnamed protein product [Mytilus coruscus]|uniref:ZP domain-containing protein n=1 Tax=Mytilus coruscus TaxID=42192 RepID=A0A6J8CQZ7_MYTCO|nr:unnamed protein product [Mytilus coruscus]